MCFKLTRFFKIIFGGFLLSLAACGLKVGEPSPISSMDLGMSSTACLKGGDQIFVDFMDGKASEAQVIKLWDCANQAIQLFTERTRGEKTGLYSPKELRGFLEAYFLNPGDLNKGDPDYIEISDRLLAELMNLKRAIVGGAADSLTAQELGYARQILDVIKEESLRLRPYFPLSLQHAAEVDAETLQEMSVTFEKSLVKIGSVLKPTHYNYEFSSFDVLLEELAKISSTPEVAEAMEATRRKIPLFQSLKAVLYGPDRREQGQGSIMVGDNEWEGLFSAISRAYGIYLKYGHSQKDRTDEFYRYLSQNRERIVAGTTSVLHLLDEVSQRYPNEEIPLKVFEDLIDQIEPEKFILGTRVIQREHLKKFLCPLVLKVMGDSTLNKEDPCQVPTESGLGGLVRREAYKKQVLSRMAIRKARNLVEEWAEGQHFIDLLFSRYADRSGFGEPDELERSKLLAIGIPQTYRKSKDEIPIETWMIASKIRGLISSRIPFFTDDEELYIGPVATDPIFTRRDLAHLNLMSFASRLLLKAYVGDSRRVEKRIDEEELKTAYFDFRDLGVDLKIFDPRKTLVYKKRLLEANLFTLSGDGDGLLSLEESSQILAYMYSSKNQSKRAHDLMGDICNHGGQSGSWPENPSENPKVLDQDKRIPIDLFGQELIDADCYRREYFRNHSYIWKHLPGLEAYYNSLSTEKRAQFSKNFEKVARGSSYSQKQIDSTDSESLAGLGHYVETFFLRFDRNADGLLSEEEAVEGPRSAFVILKNTLESASCKAGHCLHKASDLEDLFTYLLYYGEIPSGTWSFVRWKAIRPFVTIEADRGRMIELMAKIASSMSDSDRPR